MTITLGERARDTLTGITGIAVARVDRLGECPVYGLEVTDKNYGALTDIYWFAEPRVVPVPADEPNPWQKEIDAL